MNTYFYYTLSLCVALLVGLASCQSSSHTQLKVAATSIPHAEILEAAKPMLREQNINLEILIIDDYNTPNRALADKEVDANFFQHLPFLEAQQKDFGYAFEILAPVHLEPMGIYSKKVKSLKELSEGSVIAIPSDPSNQARALMLIDHLGLIEIKDKGAKTSILDIVYNPMQLQFVEMDSALLSRALDDVDAAAITTNFALLAKLSPQRDALASENAQSRFVNVVVVRQGESTRDDLLALKKVLTGEKISQFIQQHYQGAVIPAFKGQDENQKE